MNIDDLRKTALQFPDAVEAPHHEMLSFRVGKKIFATVPPSGEHVHIFVDQETAEAEAAAHAGICDILLWGKNFAGLRVRLAGARAPFVRRLLKEAFDRRRSNVVGSTKKKRG